MLPLFLQALSWFSRVCGFETISAFPKGHAYARTHWSPAYFDIASDLKPDQIERALCAAIANTPSIFAHIANPTPRMQRELLSVIEARMRRSCGDPTDLLVLLANAYRSPHTQDALPGMRRAIEAGDGNSAALRDFLSSMPAAFDIIEALP